MQQGGIGLSEYSYDRPAMTLEEAAMVPAKEPGESETSAVSASIGRTPATERTPARLSTRMREKMRQSEQAADRMRGPQVVWMNAQIPVHNEPAAPQRKNVPSTRQQTSPRMGTYVKTREAVNASSPMQGVLQGTVRRMLKPEMTVNTRPVTAHQAMRTTMTMPAKAVQEAIALPAGSATKTDG